MDVCYMGFKNRQIRPVAMQSRLFARCACENGNHNCVLAAVCSIECSIISYDDLRHLIDKSKPISKTKCRNQPKGGNAEQICGQHRVPLLWNIRHRTEKKLQNCLTTTCEYVLHKTVFHCGAPKTRQNYGEFDPMWRHARCNLDWSFELNAGASGLRKECAQRNS